MCRKNKMRPFLKKFCDIIDESPLKDTSKLFNKSRLKRLTDIIEEDVDFILENSSYIYKKLQEKKVKYSTQRAFVSTIMTLFKYVKRLKKIISMSYKSWQDIACLLKDKKSNNTVKYAKWSDIIERRDTLNKESIEYFIISLYTYLDPTTNDLYKIKFYNKLPTHVVKDYWIIDKKKSIIHSKNSKIVPNELDNIVRNNLKYKPRRHLILSQSGEPYKNIHSYNVYIDRIMKKVFGKNFSLSILRKSYERKNKF